MKIVIFGANGPTGRLATTNALARGHEVRAFTRRPEAFPFTHDSLSVVAGDVADPDAVHDAISGTEAVLSALGVPYSRQPITVYSTGTANILRAMDTHGVARLACISSSVTDPTAGPHGGFFFEHVLQPFVTGVLGRTLYEDMRRMEQQVRASDVEWTVLRPSGLFDAPNLSEYAIAEAYLPEKFTARVDLADALVEQLTDRRFVRTTAAVATLTGAPSLGSMILREAFGRKDSPAASV